MEILRQLLLALEQAKDITDVNIAAGQLRQELEEQSENTRRALTLINGYWAELEERF